MNWSLLLGLITAVPLAASGDATLPVAELEGAPYLEPGPRHPVVGAAAERAALIVPSDPTSLETGRWLQRKLGTHADTEWDLRRIPAPHGGAVIILQETWLGRRIAGSRLALRLDARGRLRQVIGRALDPRVGLPAETAVTIAAMADDEALWWPTRAGLVAARGEVGPLVQRSRAPSQVRRIVRAKDGHELGREQLVHTADVSLVGWPENPLSTPQLETYTVQIHENAPYRLESDQVLVYHQQEENFFPTPDDLSAFPSDPPPIEDTAAHRDPDDPYSAIQAFQYASRFFELLNRWGWSDPNPPMRITVNAKDCDWAWGGENITTCQGPAVDVGYDSHVLTHEIGHVVTWSWGRADPSPGRDDPGRTANDAGAINEGSSDYYAGLSAETEELFQYFGHGTPAYQGPRLRHLAIPYRCPENIVGETHMDGRIWASAVHQIQLELAASWGDVDTYPPIFNTSMASISQFPQEQTAQFADASEILVDEVRLALGDEPAEFAADVLADFGLSSCSYAIDIRQEPSVLDPGGEVEPLDARFIQLRSHDAGTSEATIREFPPAPPVEYRVSFGPDEGGLVVRYVPDRWAAAVRDEAPDQTGVLGMALVRSGSQGVGFSRVEGDRWMNESELSFDSEPDPETGPLWHKIVIHGLQPSTDYSIALVSRSVEGPVLFDEMKWELFGGEGDDDDDDDDTGTDGDDDDDGEESGTGTSADPGVEEVEGCGCGSGSRTRGWMALCGLLFVGFRSARRRVG